MIFYMENVDIILICKNVHQAECVAWLFKLYQELTESNVNIVVSERDNKILIFYYQDVIANVG